MMGSLARTSSFIAGGLTYLPLICNQVLQSQHIHEKPRYFLIWSKNYWLSLAFRSLFTIYFYTYACQERLCSQNLYPSTIVKQYSISTLHYKFKYLLKKKKNLIFMVEWYERANVVASALKRDTLRSPSVRLSGN